VLPRQLFLLNGMFTKLLSGGICCDSHHVTRKVGIGEKVGGQHHLIAIKLNATRTLVYFVPSMSDMHSIQRKSIYLDKIHSGTCKLANASNLCMLRSKYLLSLSAAQRRAAARTVTRLNVRHA